MFEIKSGLAGLALVIVVTLIFLWIQPERADYAEIFDLL